MGKSSLTLLIRRDPTYPAAVELGEEQALLLGCQIDPACDLVQRTEAAPAKAGRGIDGAHAGARRARRVIVSIVHETLCSDNGSLASNARATRDTGARPRKLEMYWPARRNRVMSTPVSMPKPSSKYKRSSLATLPVAPFA